MLWAISNKIDCGAVNMNELQWLQSMKEFQEHDSVEVPGDYMQRDTVFIKLREQKTSVTILFVGERHTACNNLF